MQVSIGQNVTYIVGDLTVCNIGLPFQEDVVDNVFVHTANTREFSTTITKLGYV